MVLPNRAGVGSIDIPVGVPFRAISPIADSREDALVAPTLLSVQVSLPLNANRTDDSLAVPPILPNPFKSDTLSLARHSKNVI